MNYQTVIADLNCTYKTGRSLHFTPIAETVLLCYSNSARFKFWGVALPTTLFDFQGKVEDFCHPTLLKIRFKIRVTRPPLLDKGQSQNYGASINSNGLLTLSGLLSLKFLLHMTTSFIKGNHFNNCI